MIEKIFYAFNGSFIQQRLKSSQNWKGKKAFCCMVAMAAGVTMCNKILGKVTKFGGKRTKTLGVANVPPPPPLGLKRVTGRLYVTV